MKEYADHIQPNADIGRLTWYGVGGTARFLAHPGDTDELAEIVVRARDEGVPLKVLGSGANVLISDDGFDGVVVRLDRGEFRRTKRRETTLTAGAGVDLMVLTKKCSEQGLAGLEGLAGIPATIGGAVRMNAGGRFGEFGNVVREVRLLDRNGAVLRWDRGRIGFGYRRSDLGDRIVLDATLELSADDPSSVRRRYTDYFAYKTKTQPIKEHTAGCVFKNPAGSSAGALIDRAGLKGARRGAVYVSDRHANFMIAGEGATASDVLRLIDYVRDCVRRAFDTELELEIEVW